MGDKKSKLLLFTALLFLATALWLKSERVASLWFWTSLTLAILFKVLFLLRIFTQKNFKPTGIYFILWGVLFIFLIKLIHPTALARTTLFSIALLLKTVGVVLILVQNRKEKE